MKTARYERKLFEKFRYNFTDRDLSLLRLRKRTTKTTTRLKKITNNFRKQVVSKSLKPTIFNQQLDKLTYAHRMGPRDLLLRRFSDTAAKKAKSFKKNRTKNFGKIAKISWKQVLSK